MGRAVTGQSMRGSFCAYAQAGLLFAGKLTDIGDAGENGLEAVEQLKAIIAELLVLVHDHNLVEETVDGRAQGGEGGKCGRVVLGSKGGIDSGLSSLGGVGKRELDLAHQAAVILRTQLGLGDMRGAGIGSRQVVERLSVVLAGLVEGGAAGEEDGRGDNVHRGDGGNGIGRDLFVAGHAHQAAMEEVANPAHGKVRGRSR